MWAYICRHTCIHITLLKNVLTCQGQSVRHRISYLWRTRGCGKSFWSWASQNKLHMYIYMCILYMRKLTLFSSQLNRFFSFFENNSTFFFLQNSRYSWVSLQCWVLVLYIYRFMFFIYKKNIYTCTYKYWGWRCPGVHWAFFYSGGKKITLTKKKLDC